ncbi:hypothetical protein AALO_G00260520 [Alosa alosa]|uniref:Uncharacterized protein n=1 Tax=Alosa alosa TaxID=278164 RepID=A0AAV6FXB4_9TELE|nr:hypothetical protein AALO_G00260520 [Alosa alosa]
MAPDCLQGNRIRQCRKIMHGTIYGHASQPPSDVLQNLIPLATEIAEKWSSSAKKPNSGSSKCSSVGSLLSGGVSSPLFYIWDSNEELILACLSPH